MKLNKKYLIIGSLSSLILAGSITSGVLLANYPSIQVNAIQQAEVKDVSKEALIDSSKTITLHQLQTNTTQWDDAINAFNNDHNGQPLAQILFNSAGRFLNVDFIPGNVNSIEIKSITPDKDNDSLSKVIFYVGGQQVTITVKQNADYKNTQSNIWLIILVSVSSAALVVGIFGIILKLLPKKLQDDK